MYTVQAFLTCDFVLFLDLIYCRKNFFGYVSSLTLKKDVSNLKSREFIYLFGNAEETQTAAFMEHMSWPICNWKVLKINFLLTHEEDSGNICYLINMAPNQF